MKIYADLYKGYIKLYDKEISKTTGHDIKELEVSDTLASKTIYVGLSLASCGETYGYGIQLSNSLDHIRAVKAATDVIAIQDLKNKDESIQNYNIKNFEYYLNVTKI